MSKTKVTSHKVATKASKILSSRSTGANSKKAAGSALSQTRGCGRNTSKSVAKSASKVLRDGRSSKASKSVAGSALSQTSSRAKKKSLFLRTARSLNLEGPSDWSSRFDDYNYGRKR